MILTKQELALKAIAAAEQAGVAAGLVCAIIEVSSGWDAALTEWVPSSWLMAQHPVDLGGERDWIALGTRWGAMQVLGQDAWQAGYKTLERLAETDENLFAGAMVLKGLLPDERKAILRWFGVERRGLAAKALAILPQCKQFVEARPCAPSISS